jgi:hypothetical protein
VTEARGDQWGPRVQQELLDKELKDQTENKAHLGLREALAHQDPLDKQDPSDNQGQLVKEALQVSPGSSEVQASQDSLDLLDHRVRRDRGDRLARPVPLVQAEIQVPKDNKVSRALLEVPASRDHGVRLDLWDNLEGQGLPEQREYGVLLVFRDQQVPPEYWARLALKVLWGQEE